jgi:hypothetical protein
MTTGAQAVAQFLQEQQGWTLADTGTINSTTGLSQTAVIAFAKWVVAKGMVPDTQQW